MGSKIEGNGNLPVKHNPIEFSINSVRAENSYIILGLCIRWEGKPDALERCSLKKIKVWNGRIKMEIIRNLILIVVGVILVLLVLGWLGLHIKPQAFPEYAEKSPELKTIPLPAGLPAPVERFYSTVYGETIPVIETVVIQGRAVIRPVMNIPFPARFVFVHNAGRDYRHYIEATLFGLPLLKVNEGYVDGESFFESPMGTYYDDPNTNQGANLALWAEAAWFPALWLTDGRARWEAMDAQTARLYVPF